MLFDVAAFLTTSASLGTVAEASGVPVYSAVQTSIVHTLASGPRSILPEEVFFGSSAVSGSAALVDPTSRLSSLSGSAFLQGLTGLSSDGLQAYVSAHPAQIDAVLQSPPAASEVDALWQSLTSAKQQTLITGASRLVGNLAGVPASARDAADRAFLAQSRQVLTDQAANAAGRAVADSAQRQLHMLTAVDDALKTPKGAPQRSMLSVDLRGQGKAAIVIGDLATADYVTYMVPGMFFKVDGQMDDWADDATDLYDQQQAWLKRFGSTKTVAVVAWMGYQTPDLTNIGSLDLAYQGRDALAHEIQALQADRAGDQPYTTVVAHSYGSTAALMALTEYDFSIDALALVGSPGSAAQSVNDLHVRDANVYVGVAAWDPVPNSAWFGSDPSSPSYGAKPMGVGGETDPITGDALSQSIGHNEYFSAGSESMRNMALIGIDRGYLVDH